jgi:CIC family chloride channel protein
VLQRFKRLADAGARLQARGREILEAGGDPRMVAAACVVGLGTGVMAIALAEAIHLVQWIALGTREHPGPTVAALPLWHRLAVPTLGGLLVGLLGAAWLREIRGHGVPEVLEAVALRGGRIRKRVALTKSLASALTIGSGGSVGREGPIVQIGASVGSAVGQWLRMPADRMRTLTAAGAAGGIAAAFNAPIAGAFFALEVIARNFAAPTFGPVVLGAVFATIVSRSYFGEAPAFVVPPFQVGSLWETPLAALLGLLCGVVALLFISLLGGLERFFAQLRIPDAAKPALGGAIMGALLWLSPSLYGVGYQTMDAMLRGDLAWQALLLLLLAKPLATSVTLGSGGSGGVFLPTLFVGGLAGGLFGLATNELIPAAQTAPGAWALVGMAALLAGTSHAPVTAILLAFELTQDYAVILPVMLASAVATLLARALRRDSIYTEKLTARGIDLDRREDVVLQGIGLEQIMRAEAPAVRLDAPLDVVLARFLEGELGTIFVTDPQDHPVGQVSIHDVKASLAEQATLGPLVVAGDVSEAAAVAPRHASAADGVEELARTGRDVLAVVDASGRLVGAVTLRSVMDVLAREALGEEVLGVAATGPRAARARDALRLGRGFEVRTLRVPSPAAGRTVRSLDIRSRFGVSVLALRRGAIDEGVDPDRPLARGDVLVTVGAPQDLDRLVEALQGRG